LPFQLIKHYIWLILIPLVLGLFAFGIQSHHYEAQPLPTLMVLPSATMTDTPTVTHTPTVTATPTHTPTFTATYTASPTATFTATPTLAVRLLEIEAIMPGVFIPSPSTPFPQGTILLPAPPQPIEPLPDATDEPPPYTGWYSFESDHPTVHYSPPWQAKQVLGASRGQYHRTEQVTGNMSFIFEGEGLRIRYVAAQNMGIFDVIVDDVLMDRVDAYSAERIFPGTRVYTMSMGVHTLTIRNAQQKNDLSEGYVVGLDAIQVFRSSQNMLILTPPAETAIPTSSPMPAVSIKLISAPSTVQPTHTPVPPTELYLSIVIAYDENGNRAVDPAEGVRDISVRIVEAGSNTVMTQTVTDTRGHAQLTLTTSEDIRVVVPYFGKVWEVSGGQRGRDQQFTLLLEPGNQPGLIP
jgi:hypothetical protein